MKGKRIRIGISVIAGLIAVIHVAYPSFNIDKISLALIAIAIIPWLSSLFESLEFPGGWKIKFQEQQKQIKQLGQGLQQTEENVAKVKDHAMMNYWYNIGETYRFQNKWKDARYAYNKSIEINRHYVPAYIGQAETYLSEGKLVSSEEERKYLLEQALENCENAIEKEDNFGPAYMTRAAVRHALGQDLVKVRIDLQKAKDLKTELKTFIADHEEFESLKNVDWFNEIIK